MVTHPSRPWFSLQQIKTFSPQQSAEVVGTKSAEIQQNSAINKNFQIAALAISYPSKLLSAISGAGAKSAATLALAVHPQLTADKTPSFPSGDEDKDDADVADYDNNGDGLHQQFNSR